MDGSFRSLLIDKFELEIADTLEFLFLIEVFHSQLANAFIILTFHIHIFTCYL